ncbi:MAG: MFS transporter [Acidobacteriota bacterium]|nr:MFS transporter [Acidobacteriota bacterium]
MKRTKALDVARVSTGNFLEMYDFMVFGYYAPAIAKTFFPTGSDFLSLMLSLATFGAGFLMRPLGAVVLGAYIDHHGRRKGLILTLGMMAVGTLSIAVVPSYTTIGILAPLLVVAGRLIQGFSAGVELGGVSVYLSEIATPGHRGFFVSWQSASQQPAVMLAAIFGIALSGMLPAASMNSWGWRIPLLGGCLLIPFVYRLRSTLPETEEFLALKHRPARREILQTLAANWRLIVLGTMLSTMTTVTFYVITAYTPTFGSTALHLAATSTLVVTLCVGILNFILLPVMGAVSDWVGRRPVLLTCTTLALLTAYPVMAWLAGAPSFARLMSAELWLAALYASYNGAMVAYLTEIMPVNVRTSGFSLAYSLATAIFGGFTPAICTWLIHTTSNAAMPGVWLSFAAVLGLTASLILKK